MIFPDHSILRCHVPEDSRAGGVVCFDGKNSIDLERGDSIIIKSSKYPFPSVNRVSERSERALWKTRNIYASQTLNPLILSDSLKMRLLASLGGSVTTHTIG